MSDLTNVTSHMVTALTSLDISALDTNEVAALEILARQITHDFRESLAARKRALWREDAIKVPADVLASLQRTEIVSGDLGWQSSAALVRRTDTGQHYVVSTNDEETLTWRADAAGEPYPSTYPNALPDDRESVVGAVGGRGMTRAEAVQLIDRADASQLVSGWAGWADDDDTDD